MSAVLAELRKTASLPATSVAVVVAVLGPAVITLINAVSARNALSDGRTAQVASTDPADTAFAAVPLGTVGAIVIGVVAISSEYTVNSADAGGGRQITATLAATPRRLHVLTAKLVAITLLVVTVAAVTLPASQAVAHVVIGDGATNTTTTGQAVARCLGAGLYWILTAVTAAAITVLTRHGVVPLIVLIIDNSLVSFSLLLSMVTPLARYLPDLAGTSLFATESAIDDAPGPLAGGVVMSAWAVGLLTVAAVTFVRRDA